MRPLCLSLLASLLLIGCSDGDSNAADPGNGTGQGRGHGQTDDQGDLPTGATIPIAANADAFLAHVKQLVDAAEQAGEATLTGTGDDILLVKEMRSLTAGPFWGAAAATASRAPKADRRDPLPAIVDYHHQLTEAGIKWLFVPVPAKIAVNPSLVPGAPKVDGRIDQHCVDFFRELHQQDIPVLDVLPALRQLQQNGQRSHCRTDTHWTPQACEVVAGLIADYIKLQPFYADLPKTEHGTANKQIEVTGDMAAMRQQVTSPETLAITAVDGLRTAASSPILLFGDSHCLIYQTGGDMHAEHAGLASHLMHQLQTPIDVVGVRGSGATPSRVDVYRGKRFAGKKFAIWCLTGREFTDGQGWAKVPVQR